VHEGLQESGAFCGSVPRAAFGLRTAFEELEEVVRDGRGILLSRPTLLGFSCFASAFQAVLSWRPSSASTFLKVPSTGAADPTAFRYWAGCARRYLQLWMCQEIFPARGRKPWEVELLCVRPCKRNAMFALVVHLPLRRGRQEVVEA
jgi:hypothetical protein